LEAVNCGFRFLLRETKPAVRYRSEFVEKDREIKKWNFRHFIYVNLGIAVVVFQNLPSPAKTHKICRKTQNSFVPYLTSACLVPQFAKTGKLWEQ